MRSVPAVLAVVMLLAPPLHAHELPLHAQELRAYGGEVVVELPVEQAAAAGALREPVPHSHRGGGEEVDCLLCHLVASAPPTTSAPLLSIPPEAFPSPLELEGVASPLPSSAPFPPRGPPSH